MAGYAGQASALSLKAQIPSISASSIRAAPWLPVYSNEDAFWSGAFGTDLQ